MQASEAVPGPPPPRLRCCGHCFFPGRSRRSSPSAEEGSTWAVHFTSLASPLPGGSFSQQHVFWCRQLFPRPRAAFPRATALCRFALKGEGGCSCGVLIPQEGAFFSRTRRPKGLKPPARVERTPSLAVLLLCARPSLVRFTSGVGGDDLLNMGQGTAPGAIPGPGLMGGGSQVRFCREAPPPSSRPHCNCARVCRCCAVLAHSCAQQKSSTFSRSSWSLLSCYMRGKWRKTVRGRESVSWNVPDVRGGQCLWPPQGEPKTRKATPHLMTPPAIAANPSTSLIFSLCPSLHMYRPPPLSPALVQPDDLLGMFDSSPSQQSAASSASAAGAARPIPRSPPVHAAPMSHMAGAGVGAGGGFGMGAHRPAVRNECYLIFGTGGGRVPQVDQSFWRGGGGISGPDACSGCFATARYDLA